MHALALALSFLPVEAVGANVWSASADAFLVVEDFVASAHLGSADALLENGIPVLHHGASVWLSNARAGVDVEVSWNIVAISVLNRHGRAVEWAAFARAGFLVEEGWERARFVVRIGNTNARSLSANTLAGVSIPVSVGRNSGSVHDDIEWGTF